MTSADHRCPTGYHPEPARGCRVGHSGGGCDCEGCRAECVAYERARYRGLPRPASNPFNPTRPRGACQHRSANAVGSGPRVCPSPRQSGDTLCVEHRALVTVRLWWPLPPPAVVEAPAPGWEGRAACRDMDRELFYPEGKRPRPDDAVIAACHACPVRADCLAAADEHGIWGGVSADHRRRHLRRVA